MKDLSPLAAFQDGFARILVTEKADPEYAALVCQPGFSVYRNTVMKGCMDALQANFPAVVKLVGEPWFREAARIYVSERPPLDARLLFYGEDFPDFLSGFPPAADWPYLPGVARLDRFWIECQTALDDEAQDPAKLLTLAPDALGATVVRPRAMTRWKWFDGMPVYTIWCVNRSDGRCHDELEWRGEGALLVRRGMEVRWMEVGPEHCAFLDACAAGLPLADAAAAAIEANADADIPQLIATLLSAGALAAHPNVRKELT
jgi:hypothetical protein